MVKLMNDRLDSIEEIAQIGSLEIDLTHRSLSVSKNFAKIFGLVQDHPLDFQDLKDIIHPDYFEFVVDQFENSIKLKQVQVFEAKCKTAENSWQMMEGRIQPVFNDLLIPIKLKGVIQVTSDKKVDESHVHDLVKMNKIKDEILAMVAHDLKSPINRINGILNLLKLNPDNSNREFIGYMENACNMASNIIQDLIEISEMSENSQYLRKSKMDINQLIRSTVVNYLRQAEEKNISINTNLCDEAEAMILSEKISRVLDNLISNSIKFSRTNGLIEVSSEIDDNHVTIRVKDHGIGISQDKLPYIFDRFSNARRPGTNGEKSTGLGLSIVRSIVTHHNGRVWVNSKEGAGSEFVVELPREI